MSASIFDRFPDAEVNVPEGQWLNRYHRYGNVWFFVSDFEKRIVPAGEHWLLHHIERLTRAHAGDDVQAMLAKAICGDFSETVERRLAGEADALPRCLCRDGASHRPTTPTRGES